RLDVSACPHSPSPQPSPAEGRGSGFPLSPVLRGEGRGEGFSARTSGASANSLAGGRRTYRWDSLQTVPPTSDSTLATKERHAKTHGAHADRRVRRRGLQPSSTTGRFHAGDILPTDVDEASCFALGRATGNGRAKQGCFAYGLVGWHSRRTGTPRTKV